MPRNGQHTFVGFNNTTKLPNDCHLLSIMLDNPSRLKKVRRAYVGLSSYWIFPLSMRHPQSGNAESIAEGMIMAISKFSQTFLFPGADDNTNEFLQFCYVLAIHPASNSLMLDEFAMRHKLP